MLGQRQRRWADVVQTVYKCFVFAGMNSSSTGDASQRIQTGFTPKQSDTKAVIKQMYRCR